MGQSMTVCSLRHDGAVGGQASSLVFIIRHVQHLNSLDKAQGTLTFHCG